MTVEIDQQTHRVRAIAVGAAEMHAKDLGGSITEREARAIAANSMGLPAATLRLAETSGCASIARPASELGGCARSTVEARSGAAQPALVCPSTPRTGGQDIERVWRETSLAGGGPTAAAHGLFLLYEDHVADLSGVETLAQAVALAASELERLDGDAPDRPGRRPRSKKRIADRCHPGLYARPHLSSGSGTRGWLDPGDPGTSPRASKRRG